MITTKWYNSSDNLDDLNYILLNVFVKEQAISKDLVFENTDKINYYLVVYENNLPVATGKLAINEDKYILKRIAVLKESRGLKYGDLVVRMLVRKAFDLNAKEVFLSSQKSVQAFYEKLGFIAISEVYTKASIPHIDMVKKDDVCGNCSNH